MIVPMKKVAIIMQAKDSALAIRELRKIGVLHVQHQNPPQGRDINSLQEDLSLVNNALDIFSFAGLLGKEFALEKTSCHDWKFAAKHAVDLWKRYDQLELYSKSIINSINEWEGWGDFEPIKIQELASKSIFVRLYQVPLKQINEFPEGVVVEKIFTKAGLAHCVVISRQKSEFPYKEIPLPRQSLSAMRNRLIKDKKEMDLIKDEIGKLYEFFDEFIAEKEKLLKEIEFQQALSGMGKEGSLAFVTGYIPDDQAEVLLKEAKSRQWGIVIGEPSGEEEVPTLIRNPKWVSIIAPVFKMLEIIPGYRELDVSLLFLIFFSLFFGILIGDAGYGAIYLLITVWAQRKFAQKHAGTGRYFFLFYVLNFCAIIWGLLTGTFFGQEWLAAKGIKPVLPALNEPKVMQTFCFFLGALQLTIAHFWRALVKFPGSAFLADIGWIAILWISYFLAGTLILGNTFPDFGLALALFGIALVLFFTEPRKNILSSLGASFISITFGLSFMSAFTDVVSYVRLFAVGLAGVAIANTTNTMISGLGTGCVAIFFGILIGLIGHGLNIVLGPIAILVHGVRLNVLEFGLNHTGITWSGLAYRPLKE